MRPPADLKPSAESFSFWAEQAYGRGSPRPAPGNRAPESPTPFQAILWPLAAAAGRRLREHSACRPGTLAGPALGDLELHLLVTLAKLAGRSLLQEFHAFRHPRKPTLDLLLERAGGDPGDRVYRAFVRAMLDGGAVGFFQARPPLAGLLAAALEHWLEAAGELLGRYQGHRRALAARFNGGRDLGPIARIQPGAGDRHNRGRTTHILDFRHGLRLVYKPVPAGIVAAWTGLLGWLNRRGADPDFRLLRHLSLDDHGWTEFVATGPCRSREQVRRYYGRCGALLCLAHALGASDCHLENLLAAGEHPVLVDLETVMCPDLWPGGRPTAFRPRGPAEDPLRLGRTGLLPQWTLFGAQLVDLSALGAFEPAAVDRPVWVHPNTDLMDCQWGAGTLAPGPGIPVWRGRPAPPLPWVEDLVQGFRAMHRFLARHRDALLAPGGPLAAFRGRTVRAIARPTHQYERVLFGALAPEVLGDPERFAARTDLARRDAHGKALLRVPPALAAAETRALRIGDIPYFAMSTSGTGLRDGAGRVLVPGVVARRCADLARDQLWALDGAGLERDVAVIRAAFLLRAGASASGFESGEPAHLGPLQGPRHDITRVQGLEEAARLGERLWRQAARPRGGDPRWIALHHLPGRDQQILGWSGPDLYTGQAGIGLFLAALARATGEKVHRNRALAAFRPLLRGLSGADPEDLLLRAAPHGAAGLGGVIYALVQAGLLLDEPGFLAGAAAGAALATPARIAEDRDLGLLWGSAGTLLGLLALWRATGSQDALDRAMACGRRLLQVRGPGPGAARPGPALGGLGHGSAGIAHALRQLGGATGDPRVLRGAERLAAGAAREPGALALLALADPGTRRAEPGLEAGMAQAARWLPGDMDHLCGGTFGRVELLLQGGQARSRPEWTGAARTLAGTARAARRGGYRLWPGAVDLPLPGLFKGLAGIGYTLLRLADPEGLPGVLWLTPPAAPPAA
ncbi:MAG: type 2 lanthipeptide synthetase LanM [Holophaga sp.]|jgi:type 2 lantibiotic biosynthesis protein LanM